MKYALENDCEYNKKKILKNIKSKDINIKDCLQYIKNNF